MSAPGPGWQHADCQLRIDRVTAGVETPVLDECEFLNASTVPRCATDRCDELPFCRDDDKINLEVAENRPRAAEEDEHERAHDRIVANDAPEVLERSLSYKPRR